MTINKLFLTLIFLNSFAVAKPNFKRKQDPTFYDKIDNLAQKAENFISKNKKTITTCGTLGGALGSIYVIGFRFLKTQPNYRNDNYVCAWHAFPFGIYKVGESCASAIHYGTASVSNFLNEIIGDYITGVEVK